MAAAVFNSEQDFIQSLREGNELTFSQLHKEYELPLFYFTNKLIQDPQESKRIVSETFMKLWQLKANFGSKNSIAAFLHVTCRNAGLDFLRHQATQKSKREVSIEDYKGQIKEAEENTILHQMIQTEVMKQLMDAIEQLPPVRRSVLKMIYLEGLNTEEVAKRLNVTPQNVRNTKFQALQQLRNHVIEKKIISLLLLFFSTNS